MRAVTESKSFYRERFDQVEKTLANGARWSLPIRKAAIARFSETGFPTLRDEEWKYTNVAPIAQMVFAPAAGRNGVAAATLERLAFGSVAAHRLVFVDGHYAHELSVLRPTSAGAKIDSLAAVLKEDPAVLEPHLARYADYQDHPFVALNTAFMADGAFVSIPDGSVLDEPVELIFVSTGRKEATDSHPRNLIVAGRHSQATIIERYVGIDPEIYWTNAVTEIVVGESAVVDHYRLQSETQNAFHTATLQVYLERSSNFASHSIALGGALVRNDVNAVLGGEGGECVLNGLYIATGRQHVDNHTRIDHVKPHCSSRELYKGVLDDKARGVFNGKIYVHKTAQKTDAKQTNNNLILSGEASVDTKPQLEIYNNDVKCTHGSTIGQLNADALFYLRARGLDVEAARGLLTYGFVGDMIGRVKVIAVRDQLEKVVTQKLRGNPTER